jgi:lysophospholipase L1-like esterase
LINEKFPKSDISYEVIAVGGSGSVHWLFPEINSHPTRQDQCDFNRIINADPDLVIIEFVNDDYLTGKQFDTQYNRILDKMKKLNAEIIFVTPHLTWPGKLGISDLRASDPRPYTTLLKQFAADNNCALADASGGWSQTWKRGIPYVTYLKNGINHPDDRGHALIADEIAECFEEHSE